MVTVRDFTTFLESFAPLQLAEDWDNVGLLVGDRDVPVERLMTCLTITPESVAEAVERQVQLIVTHHPLPFRPLQKITTETTIGRMLLRLIQNSIAVYSPHTAFDSALSGINQRLADRMRLQNATPLIPHETIDTPGLGSGRIGTLLPSVPLRSVAERLKKELEADTTRFVGEAERMVQTVGIACGSGGSFLAAAHREGCDLFVTGETTFHTCLEAQALGIGLILLGHFASERFACVELARLLASEFPTSEIWASTREVDPIQYVSAVVPGG